MQMNSTLKRVLISIVVIAAYFFLSPFVGMHLSRFFYFLDLGNDMAGMAPTLVLGFFLVNAGGYYLLFRQPIKYIILASFISACLAASGVYIVQHFGLNPVRDAYGMFTSLVTNTIVSLLCLVAFGLLRVKENK